MAMLPSAHGGFVSACASEWREQRTHENVLPYLRGVLRTRRHGEKITARHFYVIGLSAIT